MQERNEQIYRTCSCFAEELRLIPLKDTMNEYRARMSLPSLGIAILDLNGGPNNLFNAARTICGQNVLDDCHELLRGWDDWSIHLQYGEPGWYLGSVSPENKISLEQMRAADPSSLIRTFPSEILKERKIVFICAETKESIYSRDTLYFEKIYLLTQASMAMTKSEMEFIVNFVKPHYGLNRFSLYLMGAQALLQEGQEQEVIDYVRNRLADVGDVTLLTTDETVRRDFLGDDKAKLISEIQRRAALYALYEFSSALQQKLEAYDLDGTEFAHTCEELEKQRLMLEARGEIAAHNLLDNQFSDITYSLDCAAEQYSASMRDNISRSIVAAKDIEDVEDKIQPYMEQAWEYFASQSSAQIARDFDGINRQLIKRMDEDIEDMLQHLDVRSQKLLAELIRQESITYLPPISYEKADGDTLRAVSRNARNRALLAIPLFFISPVLSIGTLLCNGIYSRIQKKHEEKKYREELLDHVESACRESKKEVVRGFEKNLDDEKMRMSVLVQEGYGQIVSLMLQDLAGKKEQFNKDTAARTRITDFINQNIPSMQAALI